MSKDEKVFAVLDAMYKKAKDEDEFDVRSIAYAARENAGANMFFREEERLAATQLRLLVIALVEVLG